MDQVALATVCVPWLRGADWFRRRHNPQHSIHRPETTAPAHIIAIIIGHSKTETTGSIVLHSDEIVAADRFSPLLYRQ